MMKRWTLLALPLAALLTQPAIVMAKEPTKSGYSYDGKYYPNRQQCLDAKRKSEKRGTVVGAVVAGAGAALLGANLGETALIAGGGAVVGNQLATKTRRC